MKQKRTFSFSDVKSLIARHNEIENKLEELKITEQNIMTKLKNYRTLLCFRSFKNIKRYSD